MRTTLHLAMLVCALCARQVVAADLIEPTLDFADMLVVVRYVSTGELLNLQAKHGGRPDRREIRQDYRRGFSILRRSRETGALTCEIYLLNASRPHEVDDDGTLSLGHELLHCMLGDYHR